MGGRNDRFGHLMRDTAGKAPVKLVLATTTIAISCAMASPAFKANPMLSRAMGVVGGNMQKLLPDTLEKVTEALRGN